MFGEPRSVGRILGVVTVGLVGLAACSERGPSSATHPAPAVQVPAPVANAGTAGLPKSPRVAEAPSAPSIPSDLVCGPSGAHQKHVGSGIACATCHPCGFGIQIVPVTFPGGTTSAGSTVDRSGGTTTCMTACHAPLGGTITPVSWNAGPLPCTACHNTVVPEGVAVVSWHPGLGTAGVRCESCHDTSQHTSGTVRLVGGVDSTCQGCHAGTGSTLAGETPPKLVGWDGELWGDFHGQRTGQGYGGTLLAPYVRQQPPLPCTTCHDAHASANPFLLAKSVNGLPLLPGSIDRAGVGAQQLCESCHSGARHATCAQCHMADPMPAGAPCLGCHGHEGTLWFPWPGGSPVDYHDQSQNSSCDHCHNFAAPIAETTPPVISQLQVTAGATDATVSWNTSEVATSFVEYGTSEPVLVAGDPGLASVHSVQLVGLAENSEYKFRIRTSDRARNVAVSGIQAFTTLCPTCAPTSLVPANPSFETPVPATTELVGAWWKDPGNATYCGTYGSAEMAGANVFRIAGVPRSACDDVDCWTDEGYGAVSYRFSKPDLDAGSTLTFDVRPKYLGPSAWSSVVLQAFDASGAMISNVTQNRHVYDIIGYSSNYAYLNPALRIASPAVNTTYTIALNPKALISNGLVPGKSWSDVSKVWFTLHASSGAVMIDLYFDNFR